MIDNYNVLYTGGTFDLFHSGHVNFLKMCSQLSHTVVVSLNTDEFVEIYKGKRPVYTYEERKVLLESCRYVSKVVPNSSGKDSKPSILKIKPKIIAIGSDWAKRDYYKQMDFSQEWLDDHGILLVYIPYTEGVSTTSLKKRIENY